MHFPLFLLLQSQTNIDVALNWAFCQDESLFKKTVQTLEMLQTVPTPQQKSFLGSSSGQTRYDVSLSTSLWRYKVKPLLLCSDAGRCRGERLQPCDTVIYHTNSSEGLIHFTTNSEAPLTNPLKAWIIALSWKCPDYGAAPQVSPLPFKSSLLLIS